MDKEILFAFIRTLIALPLILLLAYFAIKYGLAHRGIKGMRGLGRRMRVIEQLPLGQKVFISLVEVGKKYYLVAHSENSFQLLKEFAELPETLPEPEFAENLPDFRQLLKLKTKRFDKKHDNSTKGDYGGEK